MPGVIVCTPPGIYLGNSCMSYLHARAHAERVGAELQMDPWIGEKVFEIPMNRVEDRYRHLPRRSSFDLKPDETNVEIRCYAQAQEAMIYTREQARKYLNPYALIPRLPSSELNTLLRPEAVIAHRRAWDFIGYGYPVVSEQSYWRAAKEFGLEERLEFSSVETESKSAVLPPELHFFPDFLRLLRAKILVRGNSSFSWVAGLLGWATVYSPVIKGLEGGKEHDNVEFVLGNWPALSEKGGCTDLHVPEA